MVDDVSCIKAVEKFPNLWALSIKNGGISEEFLKELYKLQPEIRSIWISFPYREFRLSEEIFDFVMGFENLRMFGLIGGNLSFGKGVGPNLNALYLDKSEFEEDGLCRWLDTALAVNDFSTLSFRTTEIGTQTIETLWRNARKLDSLFLDYSKLNRLRSHFY